MQNIFVNIAIANKIMPCIVGKYTTNMLVEISYDNSTMYQVKYT